MKTNIYVDLKILESGYVYVENFKFEESIEEHYEESKEFSKKFNHNKCETLKGYKLRYLFLEVEFDGRKRKVTDQNIYSSMEKLGFCNVLNGSKDNLFGGYYMPTDKLKDLLDNQLKQRKELIDNGHYVELLS